MAERAVNIREIAKLAGVSTASVTRALKPGPCPKLSSSKRRQILDLCEKLHYMPNEHTRRMFARRADTVAIFFHPMGGAQEESSLRMGPDANFSNCIMGAQSRLAEENIDLLLTALSPEFLESKRYLKMIRSGQIDGILVWGALDADDYLREIVTEQFPLIALQTCPDWCPCAGAYSDDGGGMRSLVHRVWALGHRRIAVIRPPDQASVGRIREKGLMDALHKYGLEPEYIPSGRGYTYTYGLAAAREILEHAPQVTCIMGCNDLTAYACLDVLKQAGRRVPEDISVTGADDQCYPEFLPKISSFSVPGFEIGRQGAELLLRKIDGQNEVLPVRLPFQDIPGKTLGGVRSDL